MQNIAAINVRTIRKPKRGNVAHSLPEAFTDIGMHLKEHREKRRLSLEHVAARLKIRGHYLRALEEGHFSNIPGRIYVDGYLRSYADYLGLDSPTILAAYRGSGGRSSNDDNYMLPEVSHGEMKPGRRILWLALILLLLIYSIWFISDHKQEGPTSPNATQATLNTPQPVTEKALDARVVIVAKSDVEVTVLGTDGSPIYKNLMHSGETYFVPSDGLILKASSPDNIQLFVDGENVAPTGKAIVTETGILLNPDKLLENSGYKDIDDAVE
jgi:hypothetical protein